MATSARRSRGISWTAGNAILGARDQSKATALANELGDLASATSVEEAISDADVVVFAVWLDTLKALIAQHAGQLRGKVVVDPSNPVAQDTNGGFVRTLPDGQSSGSVVAALLPAEAHFVKAFGTLGAESLASEANRIPRAVLFYATDDDQAAAAIEPARSEQHMAQKQMAVRRAHDRQPDKIAKHWIDGGRRDALQRREGVDPATWEVIGRHTVGGREEASEDRTTADDRLHELHGEIAGDDYGALIADQDA